MPKQTQHATRQTRLPTHGQSTFLKLALSLETGKIFDEIRNKPYPEAEPTIYCILYGYAEAKQTTETHRLISFSQVPGGIGYNAAFIRRAVQPIERTFGNTAEHLWTAVKTLDTQKLSYDNCSVKVRALPLVPIIIILHEATSEFAASASMLFDSTISNYLTTEQIAMLGQLTSLRLIHANEAIT